MDDNGYLVAAEQHCLAGGSKLTALRRRVLELVLGHEGVVKAYQILSQLQQERGVVAPPTVYRALDFLVEQGLLHRVEALNGFILCHHFQCRHEGLFLVCETCGAVAETDAGQPLAALQAATLPQGFRIRPQNLVLTGTCGKCTA